MTRRAAELVWAGLEENTKQPRQAFFVEFRLHYLLQSPSRLLRLFADLSEIYSSINASRYSID